MAVHITGTLEYHSAQTQPSDVELYWIKYHGAHLCRTPGCGLPLEAIGKNKRSFLFFRSCNVYSNCRVCYDVVRRTDNSSVPSKWFSKSKCCEVCGESELNEIGYLPTSKAPIYALCRTCFIFVDKRKEGKSSIKAGETKSEIPPANFETVPLQSDLPSPNSASVSSPVFTRTSATETAEIVRSLGNELEIQKRFEDFQKASVKAVNSSATAAQQCGEYCAKVTKSFISLQYNNLIFFPGFKYRKEVSDAKVQEAYAEVLMATSSLATATAAITAAMPTIIQNSEHGSFVIDENHVVQFFAHFIPPSQIILGMSTAKSAVATAFISISQSREYLNTDLENNGYGIDGKNLDDNLKGILSSVELAFANTKTALDDIELVISLGHDYLMFRLRHSQVFPLGSPFSLLPRGQQVKNLPTLREALKTGCCSSLNCASSITHLTSSLLKAKAAIEYSNLFSDPNFFYWWRTPEIDSCYISLAGSYAVLLAGSASAVITALTVTLPLNFRTFQDNMKTVTDINGNSKRNFNGTGNVNRSSRQRLDPNKSLYSPEQRFDQLLHLIPPEQIMSSINAAFSASANCVYLAGKILEEVKFAESNTKLALRSKTRGPLFHAERPKISEIITYATAVSIEVTSCHNVITGIKNLIIEYLQEYYLPEE